MDKEFRRCKKGLWDTTVPGIKFDENGISNYAKMFEDYAKQYPRGEEGRKVWQDFVSKIKRDGKNKRYDCIIGVSGGTDSSYLMHVAKKEYGLNPLAVTLDNGWASDISVKNIKLLTNKLKIDLETYVVDYEEMKDILKSYIKAGLPWIDFPTDHAIKSILYKIAKREGIKYILVGHDFRSEGMQPNEWTYSDARQLKYLQKKFGTKKIKTYPCINLLEHGYLSLIRGIKMIYPYFFLNYNKEEAKKILSEYYNWKYYGGHHHENIFTKFAIAYWLYKKFNIDKRIITYSAQVMSNIIPREGALLELSNPPLSNEELEELRDYVIKKLELTDNEFNKIWSSQNKNYHDYPSSYNYFENIVKHLRPFIKFFMPQLPSSFIQINQRKGK